MRGDDPNETLQEWCEDKGGEYDDYSDLGGGSSCHFGESRIEIDTSGYNIHTKAVIQRNGTEATYHGGLDRVEWDRSEDQIRFAKTGSGDLGIGLMIGNPDNGQDPIYNIPP